MDQLTGAIRIEQDELAPAVEAAAAEVRDLGQAVQEARTLVAQGLQALRWRMRALLEEGRREVESTGATLRSSVHAHEDHLLGEGGRLSQATHELLDDLAHRVRHEIDHQIAAEGQRVQAAFVQLKQALRHAEDAVGEQAGELESRLRGLSDAMEPLPQAIDAVRQAAREVGLLWG